MKRNGTRSVLSPLVGFRLVVSGVAAALAVAAAGALAPVFAAQDPRGDVARPPGAVEPAGPARELVGLRTETSRTFEHGRGLRTVKVFPGPVHFRDGRGGWARIDNRLVRDGASIENAANAFDVRVPDSLSGSAVRVGDGGHWVALRPAGAAEREASVSGATATFEEAWPGVELSYAATNAGVKETMTLASPAATSRFEFALSASAGLTPAKGRGGSIVLRDRSGRAAFLLAAPFMVDAAGVVSHRVSMRLADGGESVVVEADRGWLEAPERQFPVQVDPSVFPWGAERNCTLQSGAGADTSLCHEPLKVGFDGSRVHRTLLNFDLEGEPEEVLPRDAYVTHATVRLRFLDETNPQSGQIDLHELGRDFTDAATWNRFDGVNSWTHAGGDFTAARESRSPFEPTFADGWVDFGASRLVEGWMKSEIDNHGVLLKAADEGVQNVRRFADTEASDDGVWPHLLINYIDRVGHQSDLTYVAEQQLGEDHTLSLNPASGNLLLRADDIHIPGTGMDLALSRFFNSKGPGYSHSLGTSWNFSVGEEVRLKREWNTEARILWGDSGYFTRFDLLPDGSFRSPPGLDATLTVDPVTDDQTVTFGSGIKWVFEDSENAFLEKVVDASGNEIDLDYLNSRIATITDTQERVLEFDKDPSGELVTSIEDWAGHEWLYQYDAAGQLTGYTDPDGKHWRYGYAGSANVDEVEDPDGTITKIEYGPDGVEEIRRDWDPVSQGAAAVWRIDHNTGDTRCPTNPNTGNKDRSAAVTDPDGGRTVYCHDLWQRITHVIEEPHVTASGELFDLAGRFDGGDGPLDVTVEGAHDGGVRRVAIEVDGSERDHSDAPCNPGCPASFSADLSVDGASLSEGRHTARATATSANGVGGATDPWTFGVDRSAPELDFSGSTLNQGGEPLHEDSYELRVKNVDGSRAGHADERSGARSIEVLLRKDFDAAEGPVDDPQFTSEYFSGDVACPEGSCSLERSWEFRPAEHQPGRYTVRVVGRDQLARPGQQDPEGDGHARIHEFAVVVPPQDPGPEREDDRVGLEQWWQYDSTDTGAGTAAHVNLSNGNLVWHSTPVVNPGRGLSTLVNLTYNSHQRVQLPLVETPLEQGLEPYDEAGRGFSIGVSSLTRVNERMNVDLAPSGRITLTDPDGTRHLFRAEPGSYNEVFTPPRGVQLHLRRFSRPATIVDPPAILGFGALEHPDKAWAATRPDGTTHYFDLRGYQTSLEDRNGNVVRFDYEYRSPTRHVCEAAAQSSLFVLPATVCPRKLVSVTSPGGHTLELTYEKRRIADLPPEWIPADGLPSELVGQEFETDAYASGRIASIEDNADRMLELGYDPEGYLTSMTEAAGTPAERQFGFAYETVQPPLEIRPLTEITDPRGNATTIAYEPRTVGGDSLSELLRFDRKVTAITDRSEGQPGASGNATEYEIEQLAGGETDTTVTDARGFETDYELDARGRLAAMTDARGTRTELGWDDATTADNNLIEIVEAVASDDEAVTELTHNPNGLLLSETDPNGHTTTLSYLDSAGHASHQSPRGIDTGWGFVSDLSTLTTPEGAQNGFSTTFSYDAEGRGNLRFVEDGEGHTSETQYGPFGVITKEIDEVGNPTAFHVHDENGLPRTVIDARDQTWRYCYDDVGNLTRATDPRGEAQHDCEEPGRIVHSAQFEFDALDRLIDEVTPKLSAEGSYVNRTYAYDDNGNLLERIDGAGQSWEASYTPMDLTAEDESPPSAHVDETGSAGERTQFRYDDEENVVKAISPKGVETAMVDDFTTEYSYDELGRPVAEIRLAPGQNPDRLATSYAYDRRDNLVGLADPLRNERFGGSPEANATIDGRRRFTYTYDKADNRIAQVEDPDAATDRTEFGYDANDNLVSQTDPRGFEGGGTPAQFTRHWGYDKRDLLTDVTDALGRRTHYRLRGDGRVAAVIAPRGTAGWGNDSQYFRTDYSYWPTGELKTRTLPQAPNQYAPVSPQVKYGVDANGADRISPVGDMLAITDARGHSFENTYFDTGELKTTSRPSWWTVDLEPGSGAESGMPSAPVPEPLLLGAQVRERREGERLGGEAATLPRTGGFGDFGHVSPERMPDLLPRAGQTALAYDDEMRLRSVRDAAEVSRQLTHDAVGRLAELTLPLDAAAGRNITSRFGYDRNGNLARSTEVGAWRRPDGTTADLVTNFGFDQFDRRTSIDATGADATSRELTVLSYDANDRLVSRQTPRGAAFTWTYGFDDLDRLTSVTNPAGDQTAFGYDPAGNRTSVTTPRGKVWDPEHDGADQLTSVTDPAGQVTSFTYDENGNQIRVEAPGAAPAPGGATQTRVTERTFDGRDLLWSETIGSGTHARTTVTEFDPNGNLRRTVNPAGVDPSTKRPKNAWDGASISPTSTATEHATVRRFDADDVLTSMHLPYGDIDGPGPAPADTRRFRMDFRPDARGRIRWVNSPYDWSVACTSPSADNTGCPSQTEVERFDSDWIKSTSRPRIVAQDAFPNHAEKELVYDYDARGNQRLWRTPLNEPERRVVEREFAPNGTLTKRLARHTGDPTGRSYTYTHNANHSLTGVRDVQLGRTTSVAYDAAERPTLIDESWDEEASTPPAQRKSRDTLLRYDRDGNVLHRLTDGQSNGDDPATFAGGKTTSFRYDDLGRETAMWVCRPGGQSCDTGEGASPDRTTTSTYWPSSAVRERTKPNGVVESLYFFNDHRLAQMVRQKGAVTRKDQSYVYDNNGNRARDERGIHRYNARDQHAIWQRTEAAGQDKPVGSEVHYRLNGSGAILTRRFFSDSNQQNLTRTETFRYNGDRLLDVTADEPGKLPAKAAYCYDPTGFGEVRRIEDSGDCPADLDGPLTDGDVKYRYDDLSRLIATRAGSQQDDTRFTYDGLDRRDRKIERISGADQTFEYFYVGLSERLSGEQDSGRVKVKGYDYDSKLWSQGQETKTASTTSYRSYAIDANGSVEGLEGPDGELTDQDRYRYDPYGEQENAETSLTPEARENPLRFEGFYYDPAARTYDMHARPYRPETGRFLTEDRFEQASGDLALLTDPLTNNRYAFAGGNPVGNIEFDGHRPYMGSYDCGCSATEANRRNTLANSETGELSPRQEQNIAESRRLSTMPTTGAPSGTNGGARAARTSLGNLPTLLNYLLKPDPEPPRLSLEEARTLRLLHEQRGEFTNDLDYAFGIAGLAKSLVGRRIAAGIFGGGAAKRALPFDPDQVADRAIYRAERDDKVIYVGISKNLKQRATTHLRTRGYLVDEVPGLQGRRFTTAEAKSIEQALIKIHKLGKRGGTLDNKINSIARSNPVYAQSLRFGLDVLAEASYPGARSMRWRLRIRGARQFATEMAGMAR